MRLISTHLKESLKKNLVNPNGFSMLEAVVVVGVLLALAVSGFFAYGPITENAKRATVKSEASTVYTAVQVSQIDGDPMTTAAKVLSDYNDSTDKVRVLIRKGADSEFTATPPADFKIFPDNDYCIKAERVGEERIFAETGSCFDTPGGGDPGDGSGDPGDGSGDPGGGDPVVIPPYVDPTPTLTKLTLMCETDQTKTLPMRGNVIGTETWSDGATFTHAGDATTSARSLTADVTYTVTFDGTYERFEQTSGSFSRCLRSVDHWGSNTGVTSAYKAFNNERNLTSVPENIPTTITNMGSMFSRASIFNSPNVSKWDVSNVTDMSQMFNQAAVFDQPLNDWKTSKVTNISKMFSYASVFNQALNSWDTSKVINMSETFSNAEAFNQPLNNWDTSNVTTMNSTFATATRFNQPLNSWNVSNVTDMFGMFSYAIFFNQPLDNWNTSSVMNMAGMFSGYLDTSLSWLPDAPKEDWGMNFNQSLNSWNTSNVTDMSYMFSAISDFNGTVDNWDTSKVTNMERMFQNSSFNQPLNNWNVGNVANMYSMFDQAKNFNQSLNSWNTSKVETMGYMFNLAPAFNGDVSNWDTSNVTYMQQMFYRAISFDKPVNNWNVSKVNEMGHMFSGASSFNQPLNNWNTSNVYSMYGMFADATSFNQDISSWNVANVTPYYRTEFSKNTPNWSLSKPNGF